LELLDEAAAEAAEAETQAVDSAEAARRKRPDRLVCVIGPVPGEEFQLTGQPMTIGRAEECTVAINHSSVSRDHADLLPLGDGRWEIMDKGSANGIRINGVELRRGILEPGDALELGDVRLRFVAAGKWFRPAVDLSQQLPAVVPYETPARAPVPVQRSMAKLVAVGVGIAIGVVVVGAFVLLGMERAPAAGETTTEQAPMATNLNAAKELLAEAKRVAETDIDRAHKMLRRIPKDSPVRETEDFRDIEARWADAMFERVEATDDDDEKRRLLTTVSQTPTVDADRRKKAVDMLLELGPDTASTPTSQAPVGLAPGQTPTGPATTVGTQAPPDGTTEAPAATATESVAATTAPEAPEPGGNERFNEDAQRRALEPKVWSGQASEAEIRMLRAICMNQGDRACRNRCTQLLKQKQAEKAGGSADAG